MRAARGANGYRVRLAGEGQAGCPLKAALRYFPSPSERRVGQLGLPAPVGEPSPECKSAHSFTWYSENHTQVTMTGSEFDDTAGISGFSERSLYLRDGYEGLVRQLRQWQHFMDRHDAALLEGDEELALVIRLMLSSERDERGRISFVDCVQER